MRNPKYLIAIALLGTAAAAAAMDAETFYQKGRALEKKGMAAMFSSELKPVMNEMKAASKSVKAENEKAKAAGKALYCPPTKSRMSGKQVLNEFATIPQSHRKEVSVRQAWKEIMIKKYPC